MSQNSEPKIYISGLPADVQNSDLEKVFGSYGSITDVYVKPKDTFAFAFVTFSSMDEAQDAIQGMNGRSICGKRVRIDIAKPRQNNNGGGDRGGNNFRGRGGDRPRGRGCFKCNQQGHFARQCPNGDSGPPQRDNRRNNDNDGYRGNYSSRNDSARNRSKSRSHSPKRENNRKSVSRSRSGSPKRRPQKKSVSRSNSPKHNRKTNDRRSRSRSGSPVKNAGRSRSRSGSRDKKRIVRRKSPSRSSRSRS